MCIGSYENDSTIDLQDVMDGLVLGDGSVHKASNDYVYFIAGEKDYDYFTAAIKDYFVRERPGIKPGSHEVKTTITANELPKTFERKIPERFLFGSRAKRIGFLRGLYSANGSVAGQRVTLKASSFSVINDVILMLSSLGIRSYYSTNKSKSQEFSNGTYVMKESYDVNITTDRNKFKEIIGFIQEYKNTALDKVINSIGMSCKGNKKSYEIKSYEKYSTEEVFDITVDNNSHTYWSFGFNVSNCGEIGMATGVCNLGSINLVQFVKDVNGKLDFDFEEFENVVKIASLSNQTTALKQSIAVIDKQKQNVLRRQENLHHQGSWKTSRAPFQFRAGPAQCRHRRLQHRARLFDFSSELPAHLAQRRPRHRAPRCTGLRLG